MAAHSSGSAEGVCGKGVAVDRRCAAVSAGRSAAGARRGGMPTHRANVGQRCRFGRGCALRGFILRGSGGKQGTLSEAGGRRRMDVSCCAATLERPLPAHQPQLGCDCGDGVQSVLIRQDARPPLVPRERRHHSCWRRRRRLPLPPPPPPTTPPVPLAARRRSALRLRLPHSSGNPRNYDGARVRVQSPKPPLEEKASQASSRPQRDRRRRSGMREAGHRRSPAWAAGRTGCRPHVHAGG